MKKEKTIIAVGSIALDTIETPNGYKKNIIGGSASYFSIAASLFAPVKIVGIVGEDFPKEGHDMFISRKINVDNVQFVKGKTFCWGGKYNNDYSVRDTLFTDLGVFESFSPNINYKDSHDPLVFLGNIQPDLQIEVVNFMEKPEIIISDTMNLWIDLFPNKLLEVIKKSTVFLINHEESKQLSGYSDMNKAAKKFLSMGPEIVVIKMGGDGAFVAQNNLTSFVPAYPVKKLIDPTGAGDSFAGGLMGCLSMIQKPDFITAVIYGSAVASFCVEGFGLESLLKATPDLINDRINKIKSLM